MSRLYAMLTDARPNGNGSAPEVDGFAGIDGITGEIPFIEVGGPEDEPAEPTPTIPASPEEDLFSVRFMPFGSGPGETASTYGAGLIALRSPDHPISREYAGLADEITDQLPADGPSVLTFSGPLSAAGTTTVLLNLAITLARGGADRVAVVEANPHRPAFAARLDVPAEPGLGEILAGQANFAEASRRAERAGITAVSLGRPSRGLAGLGQFLSTLKIRFDWVLVDAAAAVLVDPEAGLGSASDGCYFVVREADAEDGRLPELRDRLIKADYPLRGMVLTSPA